MYKRLIIFVASMAAVLLLAGCQSVGYVGLGPYDDYYYSRDYGRDYLDHPWYYHDYYSGYDRHRDRDKGRYNDRENKKQGKKFSDYIRERKGDLEGGGL